MPPAPPTFSTITGLPRCSAMRGARMRPRISLDAPAANGTTMVSGRVGQSWAVAELAAPTSAAAVAATILILRMGVPRCATVARISGEIKRLRRDQLSRMSHADLRCANPSAHSGASGNPGPLVRSLWPWVPASAGTSGSWAQGEQAGFDLTADARPPAFEAAFDQAQKFGQRDAGGGDQEDADHQLVG